MQSDHNHKLYRTQLISKYLTRCKTSSAFTDNPELTALSHATLDPPAPHGQLSKFDLISWKLKDYHPSDSEKRLKFENDVSLHMVINQHPRPRSKPVRTQPTPAHTHSPFHSSYKQHYELIRGGLTTSQLQDDEDVSLPHEELSAQAVFKQTHQQLCGYITNHFKKYSQQKSLPKHSDSPQLKTNLTQKTLDDSMKVFLPKQIRLAEVAKVRDARINERMEHLLKKWRGSSKSINERFHEIWVKPIERQKGFLIKTRPKPSQPHNYTVPVTLSDSDSQQSHLPHLQT